MGFPALKPYSLRGGGVIPRTTEERPGICQPGLQWVGLTRCCWGHEKTQPNIELVLASSRSPSHKGTK